MKMIVAILISALATLACNAADREAVLKSGRKQTEQFYQGKFEPLWESMTGPMQGAFGTQASLKQFHTQIVTQLGAEAKVVAETVESADGMDVYLRTVEFEKFEKQFHVQWAFDNSGKIAGFFIKPVPEPAKSKYLDYTTKTALRLPFANTWFVFWGGRSVAQNYHAAYPDQRFAYDILIMKDGVSHTADGKKNEDYYCYGQPVLAPGDGRVHAVENGVKDNVPGEMNPKQPMGNHVIIEHADGEFSFLAHFKSGSVQVEPGELVKAGQQLGLCGNSGNTSEAHIHYHLQTTREFGKGQGLPAQFQNYIADGEPVKRGEPVRGQQVSHTKD
jgi:murein DD-endopeptidase MepM/ murein hydrolase activator NlpD